MAAFREPEALCSDPDPKLLIDRKGTEEGNETLGSGSEDYPEPPCPLPTTPKYRYLSGGVGSTRNMPAAGVYRCELTV